MREIVKADQPFVRDELAADEALELFADQPYKREIIERVDAARPTTTTPARSAAAATVSVYRNTRRRSSTCAAARTSRHRASSALQADEGRRRVLARQREGPDAAAHLRHGVGVEEALDEHLHRLEEAEKRDHRKLGVELDLFSFPDEIGSASRCSTPRAASSAS